MVVRLALRRGLHCILPAMPAPCRFAFLSHSFQVLGDHSVCNMKLKGQGARCHQVRGATDGYQDSFTSHCRRMPCAIIWRRLSPIPYTVPKDRQRCKQCVRFGRPEIAEGVVFMINFVSGRQAFMGPSHLLSPAVSAIAATLGHNSESSFAPQLNLVILLSPGKRNPSCFRIVPGSIGDILQFQRSWRRHE